MSHARILVVDDEPQIRRFLKTTLEVHGYEVALAETGRAALEHVTVWRPDVILLDLGLPEIGGLEVCRRVREWSDVPIIVLSVRDREEDKVAALNLGADDYLTKPFAARELLARIRAVLRRTRMLPPSFRPAETARGLAFGDWVLDTAARHLLDANGTMVSLSGAEYRLLRVFLDHPQQVLSREQLLNLTQGRELDVFDRSIDLLVSRLRQRLRDDAHEPRYIKTVRSEGYVFSAAVEPRERA
jgi:two-component system, OmpR family, response regulator